jgi:hypothetical protein
VVEVKKMVPRPRKIVEKTYYYATDSESEEGDDHVARFVFPDGSDEEWIRSDSESESEATTVVLMKMIGNLKNLVPRFQTPKMARTMNPKLNQNQTQKNWTIPNHTTVRVSVSILIVTQTRSSSCKLLVS